MSILLTATNTPLLDSIWAILIGIVIVIAGILGIRKKTKNNDGLIEEELKLEVVSLFLKNAKDLIDKYDLDGTNTFTMFYESVEEKLKDYMKSIFVEKIGDNNTLNKYITPEVIDELLNLAFNTSNIQESIEKRYDNLIDSITIEAEEYENRITEENESFENETAEVEEYVENDTVNDTL